MTPAALLTQLRAEVDARFPADQATLGVFLANLARVLDDPVGAAREATALVSRFEDYLEALIVRERRL